MSPQRRVQSESVLHGVLKQSLVHLLSTGQRWQRCSRSTEYAKILECVTQYHEFLTDAKQIESSFNQQVGTFDSKKAIHLEGVEDGGTPTVPLLWFSGDLKRNPPELRLRVGLFFVARSDRNAVRSVGFRVETSEGDATAASGKHDFCHLQPIIEVTKGGPRLYGVDPDISTKVPTVPLPADNPTDLLGCAMVMLYGLPYLGKLNSAVRMGALWEPLHTRLVAAKKSAK